MNKDSLSHTIWKYKNCIFFCKIKEEIGKIYASEVFEQK